MKPKRFESTEEERREACERMQEDEPSVAVSVGATTLATATPSDTCTLVGDHWLFRGGWNVLNGPAGQGKTSLGLQMSAAWCLDRSQFELTPNGPMKVLFLQCENDRRDLHEAMHGVFIELGILNDDGHLIDAEAAEALESRLRVWTPDGAPGPGNFHANGEVVSLIEEHKPDVLWLDSLYKWCHGGDVTAGSLNDLIDGLILPLARKHDFGMMASHHVPRNQLKALAENPDDLTASYSGAGGMFVANNARGNLLLFPHDSGTFGVYGLRAGKRGSRTGWRDHEGERITTKVIAWTSGHIGWRELSPGELVERAAQTDSFETKMAEHFLELLGREDRPVPRRDLQRGIASKTVTEAYPVKPPTVRDCETAIDLLARRGILFVGKVGRSMMVYHEWFDGAEQHGAEEGE